MTSPTLTSLFLPPPLPAPTACVNSVILLWPPSFHRRKDLHPQKEIRDVVNYPATKCLYRKPGSCCPTGSDQTNHSIHSTSPGLYRYRCRRSSGYWVWAHRSSIYIL